MKIAAIVGLASICLFPVSGRTQSEQDSTNTQVPEYQIDPVVISATRYARPIFRVPYAVDVKGLDDIQLGEVGLSLEETLRSLPGVVVQNRYNLSQGDRITLRGIGSRAPFGVRGIKLIQDGIPLTMADGQSQLNNVDLSSVGQIEVLRGPSSSLYGNAAGGVITLQTQPSSDHKVQVQPRFLTGSNGLYRWQGKLSGKSGDSQYLVNLNTLWQDGYRDHSNARSTDVNAVAKHNINDRLSLTAVLNVYDAPYLLNPSSLDKATATTAPTSARGFVKNQGAAKKIRQGQGGVTLQYRDDADTRADITVYGVGRTLFNPIPGRIIDLSRRAGGIRTLYSRRFVAGETQIRVTTGADLELLSDTRKEWSNGGVSTVTSDASIFDNLSFGAQGLDQDEQVFGVGPFAEVELSPSPNWIVTVGGRYDRYRFKVDDNLLSDGVDDSGSRVMDQFSPMAGITYRPHAFVNLYSNFSTAFQTPTTTELSNQASREGGFNPNLDPERLRGFEAGMKGGWPDQRLSWDAAIFLFNIDNMVIPFQINDPTTEEVFFRNAGKSKNKGFEAKVGWSPVEELRLSMAYTIMKFEFDDFTVVRDVNSIPTSIQLAGNDIPGVPPQHVFAGISYRHRSGVFAETNLQWIDEYFGNDFNGPPPGSTKPLSAFVNDSYALVDSRFGIQRGFGGVGFEFFIGVNNLFDTQYSGSIVPNAFGDRFFEPAAGRTWYLGAGVPIPH
ncbi:MAG: TonB-dependent receptor [Candidatus Latescibacteria bacterium]|nr:TonB-dependent receptor [Candidatus Latescibacterota bacterium]